MRKVVPFDKVIELLKAYKNEHGDLFVPQGYCTVDGIKLGRIVLSIRIGNRKTTAEEKEKLDEIGFVWKCREMRSFDEVVELLKEYKNEHGDLLVPYKYCTVDGIKLGYIVWNIRIGRRKATAGEKEKLDEIGFVWKCREMLSFDEVVELLKEYKNEHGDLLVPDKYCTVDGIKLGNIVRSIRTGRRKTTAEEKEKLDEIGFVWKYREKFSFDEVVELLKEYKNEHGNLLVPERYCTVDGIKLGHIVCDIRWGSRKITAEEKEKLDEIGFVWKCREMFSFTEIIELLKEYKNEHGDLLVPNKYCTVDGIKLGKIVFSIRIGNRKTTVEEKAKLDEIGFVWKCREILSFDEVVELLKAYKNEHGDLLVPNKYCTVDGIKLGNIVRSIRIGGRKTTAEERAKLDEIGFVWKVR